MKPNQFHIDNVGPLLRKVICTIEWCRNKLAEAVVKKEVAEEQTYCLTDFSAA